VNIDTYEQIDEMSEQDMMNELAFIIKKAKE